MSSEDRAARQDGRERGLSLVEVMISIAVMSVLFLVILKSTMTVGDTSSMLEAQNTILIETRKLTARLHEDVSTARKAYEDDDLGRSYLSAMYYGSMPMISTGLLPDIAALGDFDKDLVGSRRVGNILLLVGEMAPHNYTDPGTLKIYRVSVYRLVAYYVVDYQFPVAQGLSPFDVARWESTAFVDRTTLTSITDATVRTNVVASLISEKNITYAWDPSSEADQAFYLLTTDIAPSPDGSFQIQPCAVQDNTQNRLPISYYRKRNAALAPNNTLSGEAAVPKYAQKVAGNPGFPHGFEVMIVGPSGARKVLVRLVAEKSMRGTAVQGKSESIATMRDI